MKIFNARLGTWTLLFVLLGSPFAPILRAQTNVVIPLAEALDGPGLVWQSTTAVPWSGENAVTHDGVDAAQSGGIPHLAASTVRTTVTGPGIITFWWKVSSELYNDSLQFRVGNTEYARISGEVDWKPETLYVPGTNLTFEWRYSKNGSVTAGQDRAWLDQVEFVQSPNPYCSYYISPRRISHGYGATTGTVYVATSSGCDWNVLNTNSWITILFGGSGVGNSHIVYALARNTGMEARSGIIRIGEGIFAITQAGHSFVSEPADQVVALGGTATFNVVVNIAPPFTYQWQFNGVNLVDGVGISGATTSNLVLTSVQYSQAGNYRCVASNAYGGQYVGASALLTVAPVSNALPVAEALDTGAMFFWKTWSDSPGNWFGQTNTTYDGIDALECSGLAPGAFASLEAKSGGPGILSFWSKTAFATSSDRLQFWIGSSQTDAVTNTADWEQRTFTVPPGDKNLRWTFLNSSTGEQSQVWLDQVQFTPCNFRLGSDKFFNSMASTGQVTVTAAADCPWDVVNTNSWITILSSVTNSGSGSVSYAVAANSTGAYRRGYIVIAEQIHFVFQSAGSSTNVVLSLAEALDMGGEADWSTIGTPQWFGQTVVSRDGADAAQSGPIGDSAAVTATTIVTGPGRLFFWWSVSSETNKDYLKFFINGVQQTRISGEVDWQLLAYDLAPSTNMLKWTYSKNYTVAGGQDRGWVDQIQFIPASETGNCVVAISPISAAHSGNSETGSVYVAGAAGCDWDLVNTNWWITYLGGPGESNGFIHYAVSPNNSREPRTGTVLIGGHPFTVTQANGLPPCTYSVWPTSSAHGYASSTGSVWVTATSDCQWTVHNTNTWITIASNLISSGNGPVIYYVAQNTSPVARSGQISVGGSIFTVSQSAAPITLAEALDIANAPPLVIWNAPFPWAGQTGTTHDGADAAQTSGGSLLLVANGPGTFTFWWKVSSQTSSHLRFHVAGLEQMRITGETDWQQQTVTIPAGTQNLEWYFAKIGAGSTERAWVDQVQFVPTPTCTVTLSPGNASHSAMSSTGLISVASVCAWNVFNTNAWISIVSGSSGTGDGTVTYVVAANPSASVRSGYVRIADKTFLVTQSGASCTISILPGSRTHGYGAANGIVNVTAPAGCFWNVVNTNSWVSLLSNSNNAGSGTMTYSVAANTNSTARTGNIIIGGQTFILTQTGAPPPGTNAARLRFMGRTATNATLSVQGNAGKMYVVQSSEDLIQWQPISTNAAPATVTDATAGQAPQRFYRTVEVP